tara:strand:+ start:277 stop:1068 length:792 start_codon:yes stop_codon:yes gene_type:complete
MKTNFKKSLGQNFLVDKNILSKISDVVEINKNDILLEIGPGSGNLTEYLIKKKPKKILVVEKDNNLAKNLNDKFGENINIINNDFLKYDEKIADNSKIIIFGNLPYNISTQILVKIIKDNYINNNVKFLILMFQKEVADRIIAKINTKNYGRLSVISQTFFDIKKIVDISPECFYPRPKIKSTLLKFSPKNNNLRIKDIKNFENVTKIFFSQRRKKIKKPFKILFKDKNENELLKILDLNLRPQNISYKIYAEITLAYERLIG